MIQELPAGRLCTPPGRRLCPVMDGALTVLTEWGELWKVGLNFDFKYSLELIMDFLTL
jgi:hypothetical protein